jgi:hypothetical protein
MMLRVGGKAISIEIPTIVCEEKNNGDEIDKVAFFLIFRT